MMCFQDSELLQRSPKKRYDPKNLFQGNQTIKRTT